MFDSVQPPRSVCSRLLPANSDNFDFYLKGCAMRSIILGLCVFAVACSSQSSTSPMAPSSLSTTAASSGAMERMTAPAIQSTLAGGNNVEISFTKWITTFPLMEGLTGGDVAGIYAGEILSRVPFDNGVIVQLVARYEVIDPSGVHSFKTIIQGKSHNGTAVLNGVITEGWMVGARTHVTFDTITPCTHGTRNVCFQGTIRVITGSAE